MISARACSEGRSGFQTSIDVQIRSFPVALFLWSERERGPQFGSQVEIEFLRHDADHGKGSSIQRDDAAQRIGRGCKLGFPESVAHNGHAVTAWFHVGLIEASAHSRMHSQRLEKIGGNLGGLEAPRVIDTG